MSRRTHGQTPFHADKRLILIVFCASLTVRGLADPCSESVAALQNAFHRIESKLWVGNPVQNPFINGASYDPFQVPPAGGVSHLFWRRLPQSSRLIRLPEDRDEYYVDYGQKTGHGTERLILDRASIEGLHFYSNRPEVGSWVGDYPAEQAVNLVSSTYHEIFASAFREASKINFKSFRDELTPGLEAVPSGDGFLVRDSTTKGVRFGMLSSKQEGTYRLVMPIPNGVEYLNGSGKLSHTDALVITVSTFRDGIVRLNDVRPLTVAALVEPHEESKPNTVPSLIADEGAKFLAMVEDGIGHGWPFPEDPPRTVRFGSPGGRKTHLGDIEGFLRLFEPPPEAERLKTLASMALQTRDGNIARLVRTDQTLRRRDFERGNSGWEYYQPIEPRFRNYLRVEAQQMTSPEYHRALFLFRWAERVHAENPVADLLHRGGQYGTTFREIEDYLQSLPVTRQHAPVLFADWVRSQTGELISERGHSNQLTSATLRSFRESLTRAMKGEPLLSTSKNLSSDMPEAEKTIQ